MGSNPAQGNYSFPQKLSSAAKLPGHIVIVVSPLVSLVEDQVKYLRSIGVSAVNISIQTDNDHSRIENGQYSVVFGSPEAWLMNDRWRTMLSIKASYVPWLSMTLML